MPYHSIIRAKVADLVGARLELTSKQNIQVTLDTYNQLKLSLHER